DSEAKVAAVRYRLEATGVEAPRIIGSVQPISLHHGVVEGRYARRSCEDCHSTSSTMARGIVLSSYRPTGAEIELVGDTNVELDGERVMDEDGRLLFVPDPSASGRYVIGLARAGWIDIIGLLMFAGVVVGTTVHGGLRWFEARKRPASEHHRYTRVKLYTGHERIWHLIQAAAIVFLILTGLEMRDHLGLIGFEPSVRLHNALGFFLLFNAFLGLFYYVTSGAIRHYISEPREFGMIAMRQVGYYVSGIFKGAPHPVERSARARLNPLQQVTYVAILNVLLPWQILTGFAIWGIEYYPHLGEWFGGLPVLMPLHALGSWLFASFILMHVYLTTTSGRRPISGIEAMVTGWEEMPEADDMSTHEEKSA
ncbi:MAG: cytochrome b/b6 domain-containing protein, partial [Holophagae bacterium]